MPFDTRVTDSQKLLHKPRKLVSSPAHCKQTLQIGGFLIGDDMLELILESVAIDTSPENEFMTVKMFHEQMAIRDETALRATAKAMEAIRSRSPKV
jgi:hypothetical protein